MNIPCITSMHLFFFPFPFISFHDLHLSFHKNRHMHLLSFIRIKHFSRKLYNFRNCRSIVDMNLALESSGRKTTIAQLLAYHLATLLLQYMQNRTKKGKREKSKIGKKRYGNFIKKVFGS